MDHTPANPLGYLIVGHGTRDLAGQAEYCEVVRQLASRLAAPVAGGFLELAEPTIAQGLAELAARGVRQVITVPLLLFTAGHAKDDVPTEVAQAADALGLEIVGQTSALERHPQLLELSRLRFREAIDSTDPPAETILLMAGRGGSDETALAAMRSYSAELAESLHIQGETAFVALAKPAVKEALEQLAKARPQWVVVQPHLLFPGEVLATIQRLVEAAKAAHPEIRWFTAGHLGPHALLIEAVLGRIQELSA